MIMRRQAKNWLKTLQKATKDYKLNSSLGNKIAGQMPIQAPKPANT